MPHAAWPALHAVSGMALHAAAVMLKVGVSAGLRPGPKNGLRSEERQKRNADDQHNTSGTAPGAGPQQPKAVPTEELLRRHFDRSVLQGTG